MRNLGNDKHRANVSAVRGLFLAALIAVLVLPLLFCTVQLWRIGDGAQESLNRLMHLDESATESPVPEGFYLLPEESGEEFLLPAEQVLLDYCEAHRNELSQRTVYLLVRSNAVVFYCIVPDSGYEDSELGEVVLFSNVTFEVRTVVMATVVLMGAAAVVVLLMAGLRRRTLRALDAKDQALDDFFANASHELKTPLTSIMAYAEGAQQGVIDPRDSCEVVAREAERMAHTVESVLDLSRLDARAVRPEVRRIDLREVVYDCVVALEPMAALRDVAVEVEAPDPVVGSFDEDMLTVALGNVLTNALRYAQSRVAVGLRVERKARSRCRVAVISVFNDGVPISVEQARVMFERFATGPGGQTGIGLAVAAGYVQLHGGTIEGRPCESGTEVAMSLPLVKGSV